MVGGSIVFPKEFAKRIPKVEMDDSISCVVDEDEVLPDESSFAHFDGVGKETEII